MGQPERPGVTLSEDVTAALVAAGLDAGEVARIVQAALAEDLGGPDGIDVTSTATIPADLAGTADVVARAGGVVAGLAVAWAVFDLASGGDVTFTPVPRDGDRVRAGQRLATVRGRLRALLSAERTALNLLSRVCGVATATRAFADEIAGTGAKVLDTRKTTPGLRVLEKYAVRVGGGANKRMGLYDVAMIKDNHKLASGGITAALQRVRATFPHIAVQVEVETVAEAVEAVAAGATFLLCDNMKPAMLREVVAAVAGQAELEATGGITLAVAREYARTGVNYLSVGALTHSSPSLDIALDLRPPEGNGAAMH